MNILVCLKQILDPEIPPRDFRVDAEKLEAQRGAAGLVMNIFCANALETALHFRERVGAKLQRFLLATTRPRKCCARPWRCGWTARCW